LLTKISELNLEKQQGARMDQGYTIRSPQLEGVLSDKKVTREVKLALLHLNHGLSYSRVMILLLRLVLPRVWEFIGIMPWLPTIVANMGWKFLWLGHLLLGLAVLKFPR
jgi:hypothetical protein